MFNKFTGKSAMIKTRLTRFSTIFRAPKINTWSIRKRNHRAKGKIIIRFLPINRLNLSLNVFEPFNRLIITVHFYLCVFWTDWAQMVKKSKS